ncbi:uncharacterized protein BDV14DRAFT_171692 [Aspergillus stella-maris]|uniref:uncharacterized protein n=1 Tax=Aspergillus stella-maris TaxID=1810926 RepID=UPI003CCD8DCA
MAAGGNFTYPTATEYQFIVADLVNLTWDVAAPVISLYELCGTTELLLQEQQPNNYSYVWTATREGYIESGCEFMLQPFTTELESYGNNITSVTIGVSKRYTDDPPPVEYNFVNGSSSSTTATASTSPTPLATAGTGTESQSTQATDSQSTPESQKSSGSGLSTTAKLGVGLGVPLGVLLVAAIVGAIIFYRRRKSREVRATSQLEWGGDGGGGAMSPTSGYKPEDLQQMRLSQAETAARFSLLSSDQPERTQGGERPRSELMSMERAELG